MEPSKALERLLGWIQWLILTLLPILDQSHKCWVFTNCKSSTSDKIQTFRTIFGISCKFLTKNHLQKITLFVLF